MSPSPAIGISGREGEKQGPGQSWGRTGSKDLSENLGPRKHQGTLVLDQA